MDLFARECPDLAVLLTTLWMLRGAEIPGSRTSQLINVAIQTGNENSQGCVLSCRDGPAAHGASREDVKGAVVMNFIYAAL